MDEPEDRTAGNRRRRWWGLVFISLGVAMIIVDATIVNVAIPAIIRDLGITSSDAQWVQEVYTLVFAALLLTWGRLADRFGRRRLFVIGALVFLTASVSAALAGSAAWLIGSRAVQGVGGAMMLPTSLSLLNAEFRGRERAVAFAVWGSTIGGTAALGPLLGGWLTTSFSWRWAFGINVPLGLIVAIGAVLFVRESRDPAATGGVDLGGALLSTIGFGAIVFGLIEGRTDGWFTRTQPLSLAGLRWTWPLSPVPVAFAVGLGSLAAFVITQRRRNRERRVVLLDLRLFAIPSFRNGNVAVAIVSLGEFGLLFSLPLWFQNVRGYTAFQTGLALLPLAVGSFAASGFGAQLSARRGAPFVVRIGIGLELLAVTGIGIVVGPRTVWWATVPILFGYGIGVGLATAQLTGVVLADVPVARSGQGSGTQSTTRQLGSALGIAVLGTVLFGVLGGQLSERLRGLPGVGPPQGSAIVDVVRRTAGAAIRGFDADPRTAPVAAAARDAFATATRWTAFCAAAFLALGLLASLSLGSRPARGETPGERDQAADDPT